MALIVQKYGGSSLATPRHIVRAAERIRKMKDSGHDLVVVVSAMGRMTDHLINLAQRTVRRPPQRELDMLMTAGERISMSLLAMALEEQGVKAISFTGSQSGIITTPDHTDAKIIDIRAHRIQDELKKGKVVIIAGFQGVSEAKEITTLGRGGSDTTAVAMAAALKAERCEILTDVDGLFTADPRLVDNAHLIKECTYEEGLELASLGAKMQGRSIELAKRFSVHVWVASSANPECHGTHLKPSGDSMEKPSIRGIAAKDGFHFFRLRMPLEELVKVLCERRIALRFFNYSSGVVSFLCESERAPIVKDALGIVGGGIEEAGKISIVSAVGDGISASPDIFPKFMDALSEFASTTLLICSNALSITVAVPTERKQDLVGLLHARLVNEKEPPFPGAL